MYVLEIPRRRGFQKLKFLKESMKLDLNFQGAGGVQTSGGGMDIFSRTHAIAVLRIWRYIKATPQVDEFDNNYSWHLSAWQV